MTAKHGDFSTSSEPGGTAAATARARSCYIAPSALSEVLHEQMSYLLAHDARDARNAGHNAASCNDCLRLVQLVRLLTRPFE